MAESSGDFNPLGSPPTLRRRRGNELATGIALDPVKRFAAFSPDDLESVVEFWLREKVEREYERVLRWAGPGDKGRDVAGYVYASEDSVWDSYQCKRLASKLSPAIVRPELVT